MGELRKHRKLRNKITPMTIGVEYDGAARAYPARCLLKVVEKNKYRV